MRLKTDLKRIRKLSNQLGLLMDDRNKEICSDCKKAYVWDYNIKKPIVTIKDARYIQKVCSKEAGCCSLCKKSYWHNRGRETLKQELKLKRIYKWDNFYHFFDTDKKCCKLPRYKRSTVCLGYGLSCLFGDNLKIRTKIARIVDIISELRRRNHLLV